MKNFIFKIKQWTIGLAITICLLLLFNGCRENIICSDKPLVIESVTVVNKPYGKYEYTTHDSRNKCIFYLNTRYSIGDTLIITK